MTRIRSRWTLAGLLLLAGCATQSPQPSPSAPHDSGASPSTPAPAATERAEPAQPDRAPEPAAATTGVAVCDDYLASYRGCHLAAGIYKPDTIDKHYRAIRDTLVEQSRDPAARAQLVKRCTALAEGLRRALHGKACQPTPAAAASAGAP